jgi:hypothetical protein
MYNKTSSSISGKRSNKCKNKISCDGITGLTNIYGKTKFLKNILQNKDAFIKDGVDLRLNTQISEQLDRLLTLYSLGQYNLLGEEYDSSEFINIYNLVDKLNIQTTFGAAMKSLYSNALDGLSRAFVQYNKYVEALVTIETLSQRVDILDDPDKLNEYIEQLNTSARNVELFDINPIQSIAPLIKAEYAEYIARYGVPDDGIFESDKLYDIMTELDIV